MLVSTSIVKMFPKAAIPYATQENSLDIRNNPLQGHTTPSLQSTGTGSTT